MKVLSSDDGEMLYFGTLQSDDGKEEKEDRYDTHGSGGNDKHNDGDTLDIKRVVEKAHTLLPTNDGCYDGCYDRIKKINTVSKDESNAPLHIMNTSWTWMKPLSLLNNSNEPADIANDDNSCLLSIGQSSTEYVALPNLPILTGGDDHLLLPFAINDNFVLGPITLTGFTGQLIAIVGSVAAGKSTFLLGCLGEVLKLEGKVKVPADVEGMIQTMREGTVGGRIRKNDDVWEGNKKEEIAYISGSVSYCQQIPAMHSNISVRENILMGAAFEMQRYMDVFTGCCLSEDAKSWGGGDSLVVTPSSSNLSGGQRLRIGIARALYAPSRTVHLDDPFSALDAKTSVEIMKFIELEKKNRLIVITTHSIKLLANSSATIITLEGGKQMSSHSQEDRTLLGVQIEVDVIDKNGDTNNNRKIFIDNDRNSPAYSENDHVDTFETRKFNSDDKTSDYLDNNNNDENCENINNLRVFNTNNDSIEKHNGNEGNPMGSDNSHELEHIKSGHIKKNVFELYLHATGVYLTVIVILSTIIMQISSNSMAFWLACWSNSSKSNVDLRFIVSNDNNSVFQDFFRNISSKKFLEVAAVIILVNVIAAIFRSSLFALGGLTAAKTLHSKLSYSVFNADISFFESISIGQMINR